MMKEYTELLKEFKEWVSTDKEAALLWKRNTEGTASFDDANKYAERVADKFSEMLVREYGEADYSEVVSEVAKAYQKTYSESAYYSKGVVKANNKKAGIGMNVIEPTIEGDRIPNMVKRLSEDSEAGFLLGDSALQSVARTAVSDTIQANARVQEKSGLHAYIERDTGAGCCSWCSSMAGKYEYGNQPSDFFRVHAGCTCTFRFQTSKTEIQRFRYKTEYSTDKRGNTKAVLSKETF